MNRGGEELEGKTTYSESRQINNSKIICTPMIMTDLITHLVCLVLDLHAIIINAIIWDLILMEW